MPTRDDRTTSAGLNGEIAALLRELADAQTAPQSRFGYRNAARALLNLDRPVSALLRADGTLEKIPSVGPKSEAIILEVLRGGASPTVERALARSAAASGGAVDSEARRERRALRTHFLTRAETVQILADRSLRGPTLADYRGDLQMHSTWSDGAESVAEIARGCMARGYAYAALTDHSYGLRIARGVSMADLRRQHREIDAVNARHRGQFRLFKGIEANIRADGSIDMSAQELQQVELVIAAPHSVLRSSADQTARMITAVRTPGVHILGHPRGRMYDTRHGVRADWDAVFAAAADAGVAIEIDGDASRQDVDHTLARRALAAGCLLALDSDAHSTGGLAHAETALAHARLAAAPVERVINCWETARLAAWLDERRA